MPRMTLKDAMSNNAIARAIRGQRETNVGREKMPPLPGTTGAGPTKSLAMLVLQVPVPPSVNEAYATVHGRRVLVSKGRDYKASVTARCSPWGRESWLTMTITITMPLMFKNGRVRKFDASNRIKLLEDAVCEGLGIDDCWVRKLTVEKVEGPWGCVVTVESF